MKHAGKLSSAPTGDAALKKHSARYGNIALGRLEIEVQAIRRELREFEQSNRRLLEEQMQAHAAAVEKAYRTRRLLGAVFGSIVGLAALVLSSVLAAWLWSAIGPFTLITEQGLSFVLAGLGGVGFILPLFSCIRDQRWSEERKTVVALVVFSVALRASNIISKQTISEWADSLGLVAVLVIPVFTRWLQKTRPTTILLRRQPAKRRRRSVGMVIADRATRISVPKTSALLAVSPES